MSELSDILKSLASGVCLQCDGTGGCWDYAANSEGEFEPVQNQCNCDAERAALVEIISRRLEAAERDRDEAGMEVERLRAERNAAVEALEACAAWHWSERVLPKNTTFSERMDLGRYSEWLTLKTLADLRGESHPEYRGLYRLHEDGFRRVSDSESQALVDRIIAEFRESYAAEEAGGAA